MIQINYPSYPYKIKKEAGKEFIFDPNRKRWVRLTPEEWVRQNWIQYLIQVAKYPAALIAIEKEIKLGELSKRFDLLVYQSSKPWMIIECKEPNVTLSNTVIEQLLNYQQILAAQYLVITNGSTTYAWKIENGAIETIKTLPTYV